MRNKINVLIITTIAALVLEGWALYVVSLSPAHWRSSMIVKDEPAAHALYDKMIETIRQAESLSYESVFSGGPEERNYTYKILLKKPNYFRIETTNFLSGHCILIGDGDNLWFYWKGVRPLSAHEDSDSYEKTRENAYIKKATPIGRYSIKEQINKFGMAWFGTILDPSNFHDHGDSLAPYIDGIRSRGIDYVKKEECEVIEVSFMKAQLIRYFWISRKDHLPQKIKEIVRQGNNKVEVVEFSEMTLNTGIPQKKFTWSPPDGWRQWEKPGPDDILLKPGTEAPGFELLSVDGGKIKLSDYRGKVIWLYIWQCGSPPCREEMPHLQALYEKHKDKGLVILGFNCADDKRIARNFIRENSVTFPNILDSSDAAEKMIFNGYRNRSGTVPLSYIIDTRGKVVDAWSGYEEDNKRALAVLKKAGMQLE
ncbi:MAG: redoxin domain-containing protein [Planctomycetes bacterium]|nr:redoxin domain-containing protein [Planctomycetota bacterium]